MKAASPPRSSSLGRSAALVLVGSWLFVGGCHGSEVVANLPNIKITYEEPPPPPPPVPQKDEPAPPPAVDQHAPDPLPTRTREQFRLELEFKGDRLNLISAEAVTLKDAAATPRRIGRFAAELWVGKELLERVRFEVPLLGADTADDSLERGLDVRLSILVPNHPRATRLLLVDRKTQGATEYPFPPAEPAPNWIAAGGVASGSGGATSGSGFVASGTGGTSSGAPLGGASLGTGGAPGSR